MFFKRKPEEGVRASVMRGVWMMASDLSGDGDARGLRSAMAQRTKAYIALVREHADSGQHRGGGGRSGGGAGGREVELLTLRFRLV